MRKLIQGIHEFQDCFFGPQRELFERLAEGQHPDTLFITCSDSRVVPNLITQTGPGELFVLRNAGNIVPAHGEASGGEESTIEFAVQELKIKDIIICGHSHCGAMSGLRNPEKIRHSLPAMHAWLKHAESAREILDINYPELELEHQLNVLTQENVLVQLENLRTHPCVASALAQNALKIHGWVYKIETGKVFGYHHEYGQFQELGRAATIPKRRSTDEYGRELQSI